MAVVAAVETISTTAYIGCQKISPINQYITWNTAQNRTFAEEGNGAQGRNRTTDTAIFSRMLYQLSYLGTPPPNPGNDNEAG
jgi:hypothetical protein